MNNINFNINERYELLKEQLSLLQAEKDYIIENKLENPIGTEFGGLDNDRIERYFKQQQRLISLRLEILAKSEYLEKLKASIDMDNAETERDYDNLDIDALLDRVAQYPATDERKYANLMWLLSEFNFFIKAENKEAIVFYAKGITELLNGK